MADETRNAAIRPAAAPSRRSSFFNLAIFIGVTFAVLFGIILVSLLMATREALNSGSDVLKQDLEATIREHNNRFDLGPRVAVPASASDLPERRVGE